MTVDTDPADERRQHHFCPGKRFAVQNQKGDQSPEKDHAEQMRAQLDQTLIGQKSEYGKTDPGIRPPQEYRKETPYNACEQHEQEQMEEAKPVNPGQFWDKVNTDLEQPFVVKRRTIGWSREQQRILFGKSLVQNDFSDFEMPEGIIRSDWLKYRERGYGGNSENDAWEQDPC